MAYLEIVQGSFMVEESVRRTYAVLCLVCDCGARLQAAELNTENVGQARVQLSCDPLECSGCHTAYDLCVPVVRAEDKGKGG